MANLHFLKRPDESGVPGCCGYCSQCQCEHTLPANLAVASCLALMTQLRKEQRIDFFAHQSTKNPRCFTSYLSGDARGKMFGVMIARDRHGQRQSFHAFSGQYNGLWKVPGWVDPVFDIKAFYALHDPQERVIKDLGKKIDGTSCAKEKQQLIRQRKTVSQNLMKKIQALYTFHNFAGQQATLGQIFPAGKGIPTGTGDCCAPKLLHYARLHNLTPISLAEFFWGRENSSASRQHGRFYPSCRTRCYPLLGFMLCGLQHD